jgi:phosphopantothenoylcysteine decarboxylase/phosphopantothenate--cysteine ligase
VENGKPCILVGVTGCIAAYKACELVRCLQKAGARVKVVMTEHASEFVGPTTFRALTHSPVGLGLFDAAADPIHHISLAQWADVFVIAPATANVLAKIACGIADDLLTTTALASRAPLVVAPAMNTAMYEAAATQENLMRLKARGVRVVEPSVGALACGTTGRGHLADVGDIAHEVLEVAKRVVVSSGEGGKDGAAGACAGVRAGDCARVDAGGAHLPQKNGILAGKRVLITSGRTEEPIDPVRFISNNSSGKMGQALAQAAIDEDASVVVVTGPADITYPAECEVVHVRTALEMLEQASAQALAADIVICAAAVSDFRPSEVAPQKLKKGDSASASALSTIELCENPDILATLASERTKGQVVVGFAAETQNVEEGARKKLVTKGADFIVGNKVGDGVTFGQDEVCAIVVGRSSEESFPKMTKYAFARQLIAKLAEFLYRVN